MTPGGGGRAPHVTPPPSAPKTEVIALGAIAFLLAAFALWFARFGVTFADDGYYVAMAIRFAQGARMFADERFIQSLGSIATGPFAWAWGRIAGVSYLALGLRVLYVVVATIVGCGSYWCLRKAYGALASATAAAAVVLAPPFAILGLSYNSQGLLALVLGTAFAFAAARTRRPVATGAAVASAALAVVAYPPLAVPAAALVASMCAVARDRKVLLGALAGGGLALATVLVWFFATASIPDAKAALEFVNAQRVLDTGAIDRLRQLWGQTRSSLSVRALVPLWGLAVVATFVPHARTRALGAALLPVAAAMPAMQRLLAGGDHKVFGMLGTTYLLTLGAGLLAPVLGRALRVRDQDDAALLMISVPTGLLGYVVVGGFTQSGWYWGITFVGAASLVFGALAVWGRWVRDDAGVWVAAGSSAVTVVTLAVLLVLTPFKSPAISQLTERVPAGAYAGLHVEPGRAEAISQLQAAGRRWVESGDSVLVLDGSGAYPLVGGRIETPSVWLSPGPASSATVVYLDERGSWPDVVLAQSGALSRAPQDPLLLKIAEEYRVVGTAAGFDVWRRR